MQASQAWTPPGGTLGQILEATRARVASLDRAEAGGIRPGAGRGAVEQPSLARVLRRPNVGVIAEIKRKSPSKGIINATLDAGDQARAFDAGGAVAISVLTEPTYFGGSLDDIADVASAVALPVLKKDFHIDSRQMAEAKQSGATAVLLIARALPPDALRSLMRDADDFGLETIVEVRSEPELETALSAGAKIVGVNSRDLETLEIDERVPRKLMPMIPADVIGVWESGVRTRDDVLRASEFGADAVLVGSALSKAPDPEAKVRALSGIPRKARHG